MSVRNNSRLLRGRAWDPSSVVSAVNGHILLYSESPGEAEPFCFVCADQEALLTCAAAS